MAGGARLRVVGYVQLLIRFQHTTVDLPNARVVEQLIFPLILGMDWIDASGACITSEKGVEKVECKGDRPENGALKASIEKEEPKSTMSKNEDPVFKALGGEAGKEPSPASIEISDASDSESITDEEHDFLASLTEDESVVEDKTLWATLKGDTIIPANCLKIVPVNIFENIIREATPFMVEQAHSCQPGEEWIVPRCIIKAYPDGIKIPVLNFMVKEA